MVVSLKANKKRIFAFFLLAAVVVGACIFLQNGGTGEESKEIPGGTNEERVAYLQSFGWQIDTEPAETREVMIPAQFNDVYTAYNVMQKAQGFDLKPFAGEVCTQYKYKINNYPDEQEVYATLLVYSNLIVGGDVACDEVDGFMHGFASDSARYGETATQTPSSVSSGEDAGISSTVESEGSSSVGKSSVNSAESSTPAQDTLSVNMDQEAEVSQGESAQSTAGEIIPEEAYPTD